MARLFLFIAALLGVSHAFTAPATSVRRSCVSAPAVSMASAGGFVPDMERRNVMNLVLVAGAALPVGWLGGGFIYFLVPPGGGTRK